MAGPAGGEGQVGQGTGQRRVAVGGAGCDPFEQAGQAQEGGGEHAAGQSHHRAGRVDAQRAHPLVDGGGPDREGDGGGELQQAADLHRGRVVAVVGQHRRPGGRGCRDSMVDQDGAPGQHGEREGGDEQWWPALPRRWERCRGWSGHRGPPAGYPLHPETVYVCIWYRQVYDGLVTSTQGAPGRRRGGGGIAFLLAQIGAHAAERFADRIAGLDLTPAQAGLLRAVAMEPGRSQQAIATQLGIPPSRFVFLVDALEQRGLVARRRNDTDRRLYALHLTGEGEELMAKLHAVGAAHEEDICAGLTAGQRQALRETLQHIATQQGLTKGVHPGYRRLNPTATRPGRNTDAPDEPTPRT